MENNSAPRSEAAASVSAISQSASSGNAKFLTEGLVKIRAPEGESVFFNPAQVFNRDLSLLVLKAFATRQKRLLAVRSSRPGCVLRLNFAAEAAASRCKQEGKEAPPPLQFGGFHVLEPLAATGLRSLRYLKELSGVVSAAVANDIDAEAVRQVRENADLNQVTPGSLHGSLPPASFDLSFPEEEASLVPPIFGKEGRGGVPLWFDVVDVDPYGSCAPFLDSAISALRSGGLLCLTSTDMCTLVGNCQETCYYKYGGAVAKANFHHEAAIRESAESCKTLHQREAMTFQCPACEAFSVARLGVASLKKARKSKKTQGPSQGPQDKALSEEAQASTVSSQENSASQNEAHEEAPSSGKLKYRAGSVPVGVSEKCLQCGEAAQLIGGPFYSGPYFDPVRNSFVTPSSSPRGILFARREEETVFLRSSQEFVELCLEELKTASESLPGLTMNKRIAGMLTALKDELLDVPLFYLLPSLCARQKLPMLKPAAFKWALRRLGFRVSHFHREPQALKTDAPATVVFDILRTHAKNHSPASLEKFPVLAKPIQTKDIDLKTQPPPSESFSSSSESKKKNSIPRWLPNPLPHWGPKGRAGKRRKTDGEDSVFEKTPPEAAVSSSSGEKAETNPLVEE